MIMALASDPTNASPMTVILTLSFFYYFFGFRQLYIVLTSCNCCCQKQHTESPAVGQPPTAAVVQNPASSVVQNPASAVGQPPTAAVVQNPPSAVVQNPPSAVVQNPPSAVVQNPPSAVVQNPPSTVVQNPPSAVVQNPPSAVVQNPPSAVGQNNNYQCICCPRYKFQETSDELKEQHDNLKELSFITLLCEIPFGILMVVIQVVIVLTFFYLPAPLNALPINLLNILHLTVLVGGGLIAYKLLTFHTPAEDVIIEKFVKAYNDGNPHAQKNEDLAEAVGSILGKGLKSIVKHSIDNTKAPQAKTKRKNTI